MTEFFLSVFGISLSIGALSAVLMLISPIAERRFAAKWRFWIWAVLALRLVIPISGFITENETRARMETDFTYDPYWAEDSEGDERLYPRLELTVPERLVEPIGLGGEEKGLNGGEVGISFLDFSAFVWAAGAVLVGLLQIFAFLIYKQKLLDGGKELLEGAAAEKFNNLKNELEIQGNLRLILCKNAPGPMVMGYLRPILIIPSENYSPGQLEFILRHELIHCKRRDVWFKLLFLIAAAVHWFNPAVWLLRRQADCDMELAVDEEVVGSSDLETKIAYSETLFEVLTRKARTPSVLTTHFNGGTKMMKKRFSNILSKFNRKNGLVIFIAVVILAAISGTVIGISAVGGEKINDPLSKANQIITEMEKSDLRLVRQIINHEITSEFADAEQPYPYYTEWETPDGYTEPCAAMPAPYNTKERCMEALSRVFTKSACEEREYLFEPGAHCYEGDDGTLWYSLGEPVRYLFIVPFESAEAVSGDIIAKTKFVWQDDSLEDCEITFKKEDGVWKIDKIDDESEYTFCAVAAPETREQLGLPPEGENS